MRCFVIRGFGHKEDSKGNVVDFEKVHSDLIAPALEETGLAGGTTTEFVDAGSIHKDMFLLILKADLVVCDITVHNPNVFYELGVRHALRRKHTVLIKGEPSADRTPFDIAGMRYTTYAVDRPKEAHAALVSAIKASLATNRITDSPVFTMMPGLLEVDLDRLAELPLDFTERVQIAEIRHDKAALRLLADEARALRHAREGLKAVGRALWALNDYEAAVVVWENVCRTSRHDLDANFALANLYDRLYKQTRDPANLELSNQAIARVLKAEVLLPAQRSEALALEGRNLKTLWRLTFADLKTLRKRRERAVDALAQRCFDAYKGAYDVDLNNFFPGVAALQMGRILQSLSTERRFPDLFAGGKKEAARSAKALDSELAALTAIVRKSIARGVSSAAGEMLVWARISDADMRFLDATVEGSTAPSASVVLQAYRKALPEPRGFFWNAARGQLQLFESLGVGAAVARTVIQALDPPVQAA